ncbi:MAG: hypothetical protein ACTSYD_10845 [Candidatus Heimdallarchaeaceae archaeon]
MGKDVTIKLPDGTIIQIPAGDKETLLATLALVTGKTIPIPSDSKTESSITKINSIQELINAPKIDRIASIIRNHYPEGDWFTSNEVCELYEIIFREGIKMSTVSTYLARLTDDQLLNRKGSVSQRLYSVTPKLLKTYGSLKVLDIPPELLK